LRAQLSANCRHGVGCNADWEEAVRYVGGAVERPCAIRVRSTCIRSREGFVGNDVNLAEKRDARSSVRARRWKVCVVERVVKGVKRHQAPRVRRQSVECSRWTCVMWLSNQFKKDDSITALGVTPRGVCEAMPSAAVQRTRCGRRGKMRARMSTRRDEQQFESTQCLKVLWCKS